MTWGRKFLTASSSAPSEKSRPASRASYGSFLSKAATSSSLSTTPAKTPFKEAVIGAALNGDGPTEQPSNAVESPAAVAEGPAIVIEGTAAATEVPVATPELVVHAPEPVAAGPEVLDAGPNLITAAPTFGIATSEAATLALHAASVRTNVSVIPVGDAEGSFTQLWARLERGATNSEDGDAHTAWLEEMLIMERAMEAAKRMAELQRTPEKPVQGRMARIVTPTKAAARSISRAFKRRSATLQVPSVLVNSVSVDTARPATIALTSPALSTEAVAGTPAVERDASFTGAIMTSKSSKWSFFNLQNTVIHTEPEGSGSDHLFASGSTGPYISSLVGLARNRSLRGLSTPPNTPNVQSTVEAAQEVAKDTSDPESDDKLVKYLSIVARIMLFLPWIVVVGGCILMAPEALETVAHQSGYVTAPKGLRRFAYWAECAGQHVAIFLAALSAVGWYFGGGILFMVLGAVAGQMWATWSEFEVDREAVLGESDKQTLYILAMHFPLSFGDVVVRGGGVGNMDREIKTYHLIGS